MRLGAASPLAALLVVGSAGCSSSPKGPVVFAAVQDLRPGGSPGKNAILRLGDGKTGKGTVAPTEFPVTLRYEKKGESVSIELLTQGESIERELYEATPTAFRILAATEDTFAPGIDIVRFPAHDGQDWEWNGKVIYAGISRPAQAKVHLKKEQPGLACEVNLKIQADPGRPDLLRRLRFWFEKDKGVVRRSFGDVSTRLPVGDTWLP